MADWRERFFLRYKFTKEALEAGGPFPDWVKLRIETIKKHGCSYAKAWLINDPDIIVAPGDWLVVQNAPGPYCKRLTDAEMREITGDVAASDEPQDDSPCLSGEQQRLRELRERCFDKVSSIYRESSTLETTMEDFTIQTERLVKYIDEGKVTDET